MLNNIHVHASGIQHTPSAHGHAVSALIDPFMEGRHVDIRGTGKDRKAAERDLDERIAQAFAVAG